MTEPKIDETHPQTARVWNYWLGGKDNYAIDRELGDQMEAAYPVIVALARASRTFLGRTVRHLAGEAGIRQFLDIGTGLPTANNTHEVAQSVAPESRIVYVDNDPLVLLHARALLTSNPLGATDYIDADLRDTDRILAEAAKTLDLSQPVALTLLGILSHVDSYDEAQSTIQKLMAGLPSGSYLVICDGTNTSDAIREVVRIWNEVGRPPIDLRSAEEVASYFDGLELLEPGVVPVSQWRPEPGSTEPAEMDYSGGVARKP